MDTSVVNHCIGEFPNAWRRWLKHNDAYSYAAEAAALDACLGREASSTDPGQWVYLRNTLEEEVPDPTLRKIIFLASFMGYPHAEIALILGNGLTAKAVTERLGKHRRSRSKGGETGRC